MIHGLSVKITIRSLPSVANKSLARWRMHADVLTAVFWRAL
jgi:hypothetical protein